MSVNQVFPHSGQQQRAPSGAFSSTAYDEKLSRREALGVLALSGLLGSLVPYDVMAKPEQSKESFYSNFKGLSLSNQEGKRVNPELWLGRVVLVNFIFTGCSTACPIQVRALAEMMRGIPSNLSSKFQLFSLSLDPLQDTPATLKAFGQSMGVDFNRWTFATGRLQDVEKVSKALSLFKKTNEKQKIEDHSTALWLLDTKGELRMRYRGNPPDTERIAREMSVLAA